MSIQQRRTCSYGNKQHPQPLLWQHLSQIIALEAMVMMVIVDMMEMMVTVEQSSRQISVARATRHMSNIASSVASP